MSKTLHFIHGKLLHTHKIFTSYKFHNSHSIFTLYRSQNFTGSSLTFNCYLRNMFISNMPTSYMFYNAQNTFISQYLHWYYISFIDTCKIFESFPDEPRSTSSLAARQITCAVINTSNEVLVLVAAGILNSLFSAKNFRKGLCWKHCKYKEWVSLNFFLGSWGMNWSAEQINRPRIASWFMWFVCPTLRFIPHKPRKKRHSFLN